VIEVMNDVTFRNCAVRVDPNLTMKQAFQPRARLRRHPLEIVQMVVFAIGLNAVGAAVVVDLLRVFHT
jgi:hypothetical protein